MSAGGSIAMKLKRCPAFLSQQVRREPQPDCFSSEGTRDTVNPRRTPSDDSREYSVANLSGIAYLLLAVSISKSTARQKARWTS